MAELRQKTWEDFELGGKLVTESVTVTETHIVTFAGLTGDYYPLHMSEEYARKEGFGSRIAHGPLTFSLAVGLVGQSGVFADSIIAFLGVDEMRLLRPVRPGDTILVEVQVTDKRTTSKADRGVVKMQYAVQNQRSEPVLTAQMVFMMHRAISQV